MTMMECRSPRWARRLLCQLGAVAVCLICERGVLAVDAPPLHELRSYAHPAPAGDAFFGQFGDITDEYVVVLGFRHRNLSAYQYDAFVFDAVTGHHLRTITRPKPVDDVNYRFASVAVDGNLAVIGTTYATVPLPGGGVTYNAGLAYVYDLTTGQLKHTLTSNSPQENFLLGTSVDILGDRIAVGSWGNAYVFDANTGAQLAKLNPSEKTGQFGISVALTESEVVVGSNSDTSRGDFTGAAFTFDLDTFDQISKFVPDDAKACDNFGIELAVDGQYAAASGTNGSYVFDIFTGEQQRKLRLPGDSSTYPNRVDIENSLVLLGNPAASRAASFDWVTGELVRAYVPSDTPNSDYAWSVAMSGEEVLVTGFGRAYEFALVPEPASGALFVLGLFVAGVRRSSRRL